MTDRLFRCRVLVDGKVRCGFEGNEDEAELHAAETGHKRCVVDGTFLSSTFEQRVCGECATRTRDAIIAIRDADLEPVVAATALHPGELPGGRALVMVAGGNTDGLRPYKPLRDSKALDVPHGGLVGSRFCWLPYYEHREAADGREHYADHWRSDPLVPVAELDAIAVAWRRAFAEPVPDVPGTARDLCEYLLSRLLRAELEAPDFDDDARTLWLLSVQVENTAGTVNWPERAPVECFDCGSPLISPYRDPDPTGDVPRQGRAHEGRLMAVDAEEAFPIWQCSNERHCGRVYEPAAYHLALRAFLEAEAEKAG